MLLLTCYSCGVVVDGNALPTKESWEGRCCKCPVCGMCVLFNGEESKSATRWEEIEDLS